MLPTLAWRASGRLNWQRPRETGAIENPRDRSYRFRVRHLRNDQRQPRCCSGDRQNGDQAGAKYSRHFSKLGAQG